MPSNDAAAIAVEFTKSFGDLDILGFADALKEFNNEVATGGMENVEAMLVSQAYALQAIFVNFSRRALNQDYQKNLESIFRMALRAQNQCRMTLETLANIKNTPAVYARQANIANGPQQVNNVIPADSHARGEKSNPSNELLEHQNGEWLDTGTAGATSCVNTEMAAVGKPDRSENG